MGEKKKKEERSKRIKQVLVIGACVIFVVLMVASAMGSGWITGLAPIKAGDTVVLDYTLYNANGRAIVTSDQQLWKTGAANGLLLSKQLSIVANQSIGQNLTPVYVYDSQSGNWNTQIAFHRSEMAAITQGVIGMKDNDKKTIGLPMQLTVVYGAPELAENHLNISEIVTGELFPLGESETPSDSAANETGPVYLRIG
ncbi:MAG TPA: hypothetical protein VLY83_01765, partial [Methanoregula sp.]|nr:hypothetical protein [Methanoregula sp.]